MYKRLYPNQYKNRLYLSRYKRDKGDNNNVLVTGWLKIWLKAKEELRLISTSHNY